MKTSGNKHGALMDSLPIAKYLDDTFDGLDIFPNGEESVQKAIEVNKILGGVVHAGISLIAPNMPSILDERGAEYFARTREARFGKALSQLRPATEEGVQKVLESMKIALTPVVDMLKADSAGPFFEGQTVSYADFVLVAFLGWFERVNFCVFEAVLAVGDGEVRTLWEACQVWLCGRGSEEIWD
ncbi:hypothetical protein BDW74DRAFT_158321 [Aspergillus multicolor]|uniref:uncharacterized protein n=1 Tax=Aspergillus multicolor TaxID=41759 RepID=UPI003CCD1383